MKKIITIILLFPFLLNAQIVTTYFNQNWEEVSTKTQASFYRVANRTGEGATIGKVIDYYITGEKQSEVENLISENPDVIDGICVFYDENGNVTQKSNYNKGIVNGYHEDYVDGKLQNKGNFTDGKKNGEWYHATEDGGWMKGKYVDDIGDGKWNFYYANGQIMESSVFIKGKREGKVTNYYENGNIESTGNYNEGHRDGKWVSYTETGSKGNEGVYKAGKKISKWIERQDDGGWAEGEYINGNAIGKWNFYYANGNIKSEGKYLDNKKEANWKYWNEAGDSTYIVYLSDQEVENYTLSLENCVSYMNDEKYSKALDTSVEAVAALKYGWENHCPMSTELFPPFYNIMIVTANKIYGDNGLKKYNKILLDRKEGLEKVLAEREKLEKGLEEIEKGLEELKKGNLTEEQSKELKKQIKEYEKLEEKYEKELEKNR